MNFIIRELRADVSHRSIVNELRQLYEFFGLAQIAQISQIFSKIRFEMV